MVRIVLEVGPYIFLEGQVAENIENFSLEFLPQPPQPVDQITGLNKKDGLIARDVSVDEVVNDDKGQMFDLAWAVFKRQKINDPVVLNAPLMPLS